MKDRLKECRQKCGLTQSDVAYALGVAAPSVSQWESGVHRPALENLIQMADLYGASLDYLIGRDNNAPVPHPRQYAKAEEKLITAYRSLSARGKEYVHQQFSVALQLYAEPSASVPDPEIKKAANGGNGR